MDPLKVSLDSKNLREVTISTLSQTPHGIIWNKQPRGPHQFLHLYGVHALGLRMN